MLIKLGNRREKVTQNLTTWSLSVSLILRLRTSSEDFFPGLIHVKGEREFS